VPARRFDSRAIANDARATATSSRFLRRTRSIAVASTRVRARDASAAIVASPPSTSR
jgi:hypothetical protein